LGEEYRSFSYSFCRYLHSPATSSLLGPNILLNTLFSNKVSRPFTTKGKIHNCSTQRNISKPSLPTVSTTITATDTESECVQLISELYVLTKPPNAYKFWKNYLTLYT
jgi:hypothetical protein